MKRLFQSITLGLLACLCLAAADSDWRDVGGNRAGTKFSRASEISPANVQKLQRAWSFHAGGSDSSLRTAMECTPLIVRGVMYVTSPSLEVIALDAATGRCLWRYDPFPPTQRYTRLWIAGAILTVFLARVFTILLGTGRSRPRPVQHKIWPVIIAGLLLCAAGAGVLKARPLEIAHRAFRFLLPSPALEERHLGPNRGLTFWQEGSEQRILFAGGHRLLALDAQSGKPIRSFGQQGVVDLSMGLSRSLDGAFYTVTSPGVLCRNVLVLGSSVGEGPAPAASGEVRGFDVRTGKQVWAFRTIADDHTTEAVSWPPGASTHVGGVNAWAGMIADEGRGLVYVPVASPAFDYYGGDRAGNNLFSDSLVALHAATGKPAWHYQIVRHDLWDYDLPCSPLLVTIPHGGRLVDAVVQPTKQGFIFVLDAETGKPLFPVEDRPVPASQTSGEVTAATQPFPLKPAPLIRTRLAESDLTDISSEAQAYALAQFRALSGASIFTPPSSRGTLVVPGLQGGVGWGGASFDPIHFRLIVNTTELPYRLRLVKADPGARYPYTVESFNDPFVDREGFPAIKPPWGELTAIDLSTGKRAWQVPLGEYPELSRRGVPITGTVNAGGSIQTVSGITFIAATKDRQIRAFDAASGHLLWQAPLPAAGHATPATYTVSGRQFLVIAAGGGTIAESSPSGDEYIAFALSK